ncbi:hypothetical protein BGZ65_009845, partial [Modicella reniformis]
RHSKAKHPGAPWPFEKKKKGTGSASKSVDKEKFAMEVDKKEFTLEADEKEEVEDGYDTAETEYDGEGAI